MVSPNKERSVILNFSPADASDLNALDCVQNGRGVHSYVLVVNTCIVGGREPAEDSN